MCQDEWLAHDRHHAQHEAMRGQRRKFGDRDRGGDCGRRDPRNRGLLRRSWRGQARGPDSRHRRAVARAAQELPCPPDHSGGLARRGGVVGWDVEARQVPCAREAFNDARVVWRVCEATLGGGL
eukprot:3932981-Pleurochrysis_carterae.AAC.2